MRPVWTSTPWGATHALTAGRPTADHVVIIPGLGVSTYLRPTVQAFACSGFRCWLVDPPGFGDSGDPPRPLGIGEIAESILAWLKQRRLTEITLLGHSSGTQVAARVVAAAPDQVVRLVLGSPTLDPRYRTWPRTLGRWLIDGTREPRSLSSTQLPEWRRAGPRRLLQLFRSMKTDDLEQTLGAVRCPVLVIRGARDPLCSAEWAIGLVAGPDRDLVELPGLPHAFPYRVPHALPGAIQSWIGVRP
ncbi:MAG: alpha/beta hydrolase [Kutzneria sp.]|nr:alpha/beta hydrolase [Kutzneria sp.]